MGYIHYRKGVSDLRHLRRASVAADGPGGLTALPFRHRRTTAPRHRGAAVQRDAFMDFGAMRPVLNRPLVVVFF